MAGILYLVSMPIGNPDDITLRALRILRDADVVVCEERRVGAATLAHYGIDRPLVELNEHTEAEAVPELITRLEQGENLALISDHGTPLVQDPGEQLTRAALAAGIRLEPIPGASSILAALVVSGIPAGRFRFLGRLPAKSDQRRRALESYKNITDTMLLIDAPYRLMPLLEVARDVLGRRRRAAVACNLTMPDERIERGTLGELVQAFTRVPFRGEFVLVFEGAPRE